MGAAGKAPSAGVAADGQVVADAARDDPLLTPQPLVPREFVLMGRAAEVNSHERGPRE